MEQSVFPVPFVNPATKLKSCPKTNRQRYHTDRKCFWEFPPAVAAGIRPIFMGGNRGHGRFQFFQPRHWPYPCMALTLVIHRQLTSLAEIFDSLVHGLHNMLQANSGGTLDKLRFSGNKSLQRKNNLRKIARADTPAREFQVGGNSPLPPLRRWPCFDSCLSSSIDESDRESRPLCVMDYTILCG